MDEALDLDPEGPQIMDLVPGVLILACITRDRAFDLDNVDVATHPRFERVPFQVQAHLRKWTPIWKALWFARLRLQDVGADLHTLSLATTQFGTKSGMWIHHPFTEVHCTARIGVGRFESSTFFDYILLDRQVLTDLVRVFGYDPQKTHAEEMLASPRYVKYSYRCLRRNTTFTVIGKWRHAVSVMTARV